VEEAIMAYKEDDKPCAGEPLKRRSYPWRKLSHQRLRRRPSIFAL